MSVVYDISSHLLSEIEKPNTSDISQWLHNLCYAQWTIKEMEEGKTWAHLKKHLQMC